jgi:hypothetical protein
MEQALEADGESVPAGSGDFPREPLVLGTDADATPITTGSTSPAPAPIDPPPGS